jgi:integrative and conjugative element protein (TIGR02256 family)
VTSDAWARGQRLAVEQVEALCAVAPDAIELVSAELVPDTAVLRLDVSLDLSGLPHAPDGIRVRPRERFRILVLNDFPYSVPSVWTPHGRWAGKPHVQWRRSLCLYQAPSTEWDPGDGMRGLLDRLRQWLEKAALGELDPEGQPLHPPATYTSASAGSVVVRADLGQRVPWADGRELGMTALLGLCVQHGDRLDVVRWTTPGAYDAMVAVEGRPADSDGQPYVVAAAIVIDSEIGFEYPKTARALADGLRESGVDEKDLLEVVAAAANANAETAKARRVAAPPDGEEPEHGPGGTPLFLLVGTPSRRLREGPRLAHLVAWRISGIGGQLTEHMGSIKPGRSDALDEIRGRVLKIGEDWLGHAEVAWARLFEDRPEVTVRRDSDSAASWLCGKKVLVLGCGALGAPVAEACLRAGAALTIVDNGVVTPGILVRQPYSDADIGKAKATALAERLRALRHGAAVTPQVRNAISAHLGAGHPAPAYDLVVDATADSRVRAALEHARAPRRDQWPPVLTMMIGHRARRGVVVVSRTGATGAGHDGLRRLGIAARTTHAAALADVAEDLYPPEPRTELFLPEPGCSAPTFVGSAVEATALAAGLLSAGLDAVTGRGPEESDLPMAAAVVRLDTAKSNAGGRPGTRTWIGWPNDTVITGDSDTLPVRLTPAALATVRAEARRGARLRGPRIETGGMLLGQIDEGAGVVFVDVATPPTPDSRLSSAYFEHGVEGAQALVEHHRSGTNGTTGFVGMWHTHPHGPARPSPTDEASMANLVTPVMGGASRCLIMIFGGQGDAWTRWLRADSADGAATPDVYARLVRRSDRDSPPPPPRPAPPGLYFGGGWGPAPALSPAGRWWSRLRPPW